MKISRLFYLRMNIYFLAIPLAPAIQKRLAVLCYGPSQVHWTEEENLLLILRSLGPITDGDANLLHEQLQHMFFKPFSFYLHGIDHSHSRGNRGKIWVCAAESTELDHLQKEIDRLLRLIPRKVTPEKGPVGPHVTLGFYGKVNPQRLADYLASIAGFQSDAIQVDKCCLYRSLQSPKRVIYEAVETYHSTQEC